MLRSRKAFHKTLARAVSSVGERFLDTEEVTCSIHVPPTISYMTFRASAFSPYSNGCSNATSADSDAPLSKFAIVRRRRSSSSYFCPNGASPRLRSLGLHDKLYLLPQLLLCSASIV